MQFPSASPPPRQASAWWDVLIAAAIAVAYAAYCMLHPIQVAFPVFDEMYTFPSAREIAHGLPAFEQTHPPLTKLLMGLGYWTFQHLGLSRSPDEWTNVGQGARFFSPVAGGLGLAFLYGLARAMSGRRLVGLLAAFLLACDGLYFVMARVALTNIYSVCFMLLGALGSWLALDRKDPRWLWLAGLGFGLGMASRWTSLVAFALMAVVVLAGVERRRWLPHVVGALAILPLAIYLGTYIQPMVANAHWNWAVLWQPATWAKVADMQRFMVAYHTERLAPHPCESPWWSWPLMLKPAWFCYTTFDRGEHLNGILALGNAFIWWASLPAMAYAAYFGFRKGDAAMRFLAVMAGGLWLVWPLARANTSFMHYMLEAIPFVCVIVALALARAWGSLGNVGPILVGAYAFLVGWWLWYYQPLLSAAPITIPAYFDHLWLGPQRWDLMAHMHDFRERLGLQDDAKFRAFMKQTQPEVGNYLHVISGWEQPHGLPEAPTRLQPKP